MLNSHDEPTEAGGMPPTKKRNHGELLLLIHIVLFVVAIAIAVQVMS